MNSLSQLSQTPQPTEPDLALLFLGSLFESLDDTLPPERNEAKLDALAWHILNKVRRRCWAWPLGPGQRSSSAGIFGR